ncbi:mitogen-activated protein kinase kinase kinase 14 isoform X1 [Boleophthalmus pectinirostris]|uniref:mitogen-activated protein kinase kinase kinase 14 isoform X1 n=2 Tax=Boleophthalmus pectinirostris TaxID=150288 RepID=UPI00242CFE3B|nr:mitogen-activated protein kinase kinase kinase 14 isoform X1 [Boleophthalmus pectinirostris]
MHSLCGPINEMAVRQRIFNSTSPFSGTSQVELKGSFPVCTASEQDTEDEDEDGNNNKMNLIKYNPLLRRLWTYGTAEQIGEGPLKTSSFIAQAECETQDSQEFSPSYSKCYVPSPNCFSNSHSSEPNNVASPAPASIQDLSRSPAQSNSRKKARKKQKRKGKKKTEKKREERHRQRVPSGVPEQESGSSLPWMQEDSFSGCSSGLSSSCCSSVECSEVQSPRSFYSKPVYNISSAVPWTGFVGSYRQESDSDSSSSIGDCSLALAGLRGNVSQGDPCFAGPFFKELEQDVREQEEECTFYSDTNEGIIFYKEEIQTVDSEYREGREYIFTDFIKEGSYGEVHTAKDVNTGFTFAAKKIALKRFNSEEVGAWSALKSSRVVELFGVVREGPNVVLFMDHKAGSLGQLISERGRLPEDLSLHYQCQVFCGLEYLVKKRVAHLDIKADNVLLSVDGRDTFLCDFGHAERLDKQGHSLSRSRELKGTETHMAPEMVKGELRGAKADVWSSCCMFLHMLNGCQPWTRYYNCRLYLKIANEPPPLREIPSDCSPLTTDVFKAGLHKDPVKRASASELKIKTARALQEVGGLTSSVKGPYIEPLYNVNKPPDNYLSNSVQETEELPKLDKVWSVDKPKRGIGDDNLKSHQLDLDSEPCVQVPLIENIQKERNKTTTVPELELRKLERDFYLSSLSQLHSAEMQEQLLSCISSDYSNRDQWEKKDSGRWSLSPGDDFSSGVFSCNSQPDGQVFSMDFLGPSQFPPPSCFEGVDVCIKDISQRSIRIREARRVTVGHIATGISDQISERVFTLETHTGQQIGHAEEVLESGLELCCVSAPDFSPTWRWRVKDGVLETR